MAILLSTELCLLQIHFSNLDKAALTPQRAIAVFGTKREKDEFFLSDFKQTSYKNIIVYFTLQFLNLKFRSPPPGGRVCFVVWIWSPDFLGIVWICEWDLSGLAGRCDMSQGLCLCRSTQSICLLPGPVWEPLRHEEFTHSTKIQLWVYTLRHGEGGALKWIMGACPSQTWAKWLPFTLTLSGPQRSRC